MTKEDLVLLLSQLMKEEKAAAVVDRLLTEFGTADRVILAGANSLMKVRGMDENATALLCLTVAIAARRRMESFHVGQVYGERDIARFLTGLFLGVPTEVIVMLSLDRERAFLGLDPLGSGTVNASSFNVRRAIELALRRGASYVIFAHNHPSGSSTPSCEDLETTVILKDAFRTVDIAVLTHFVMAGNSYDFVGGVSDLAP